MPREESNREDLLGEATALVERVEFRLSDQSFFGSAPIVAGFRPDGAFSIFFGEDPAYHFNAAGELRRAYRDGLLLKASAGRLVSLRRERTATETQLVRHELDDAEQAQFMATLQSHLHSVRVEFARDVCQIIRKVPADAAVLSRVGEWLIGHTELSIASRPNL
jgi:hypothetical protein